MIILYTEELGSAELSNPGSVGADTGYEFVNKQGKKIRVIAKEGESREEAIKRVRANHGL